MRFGFFIGVDRCFSRFSLVLIGFSMFFSWIVWVLCLGVFFGLVSKPLARKQRRLAELILNSLSTRVLVTLNNRFSTLMKETPFFLNVAGVSRRKLAFGGC